MSKNNVIGSGSLSDQHEFNKVDKIEKTRNLLLEQLEKSKLSYEINKIIKDIKKEFEWALKHFGTFNNAHEGYAVLLEEVDELWENVKLNQKNQDRTQLIKEEAIQVAAMAIRLIYDCCFELYEDK